MRHTRALIVVAVVVEIDSVEEAEFNHTWSAWWPSVVLCRRQSHGTQLHQSSDEPSSWCEVWVKSTGRETPRGFCLSAAASVVQAHLHSSRMYW